jgi:hypothetical protein
MEKEICVYSNVVREIGGGEKDLKRKESLNLK